MLLLHPFPLIVYLATFTILIRYLLAEDNSCRCNWQRCRVGTLTLQEPKEAIENNLKNVFGRIVARLIKNFV